jgi:hypothetical protein
MDHTRLLAKTEIVSPTEAVTSRESVDIWMVTLKAVYCNHFFAGEDS